MNRQSKEPKMGAEKCDFEHIHPRIMKLIGSVNYSV